ncbi:TVP38/TMEM64 family protein [Asticcacaulis sp. 201]|uniref:TVP38/TMEM64 family protein n=1 Tax=Asticcacaulis sp. 201 TaxID=3028787 RepID=UPI002916AA5A|nr:VTT domain-containing protein [Asticcacaulis sp. 201]MDV6332589.1 VTT domain-containing protein [Asticcacaulis sp. 201]
MDGKNLRALGMSLLLLALVVVVFLVGKSPWGQELLLDLEHWMAQYRHSPLAIVIVTLVFCVSALFGAPQFVLIAACVVVFGPIWGGFYSWAATVISAIMTFYMGRYAGAGVLARLGGNHVGRLSDYIGKNAFSASFIVRNIPSAPFIVVNMAFGASRASFLGFISGCALGIIPKTALVALFGQSYASVTQGGNWRMALLMAGIAIVWLGLMLVARKVYEVARNRHQNTE